MLLVAVSVLVYGGTFAGLESIERTTERIYREDRMFDVEIRIDPTDESLVPSSAAIRKAIGDIESAEWRLRIPAVLTLPDDRCVAAVLITDHLTVEEGADEATYDSEADVCHTRPHLGQGLSRHALNGVVVDSTFATDMGLHEGDDLRVRLDDRVIPLTVRGTGIFPEYLLSSVHEHFFVPIQETVAILRLHRDFVYQLTGGHPVNSLVITTRLGAERAAIVDALWEEFGVRGSATMREDQHSVWMNWNRLVGFRDFLPAVMAVFNGISFVALVSLVRRMALVNRRPIGALIALGFTPAQVRGAWLLALAFPVLIGAVAGSGCAIAFAYRVADAYMMSTGFPILLEAPGPGPVMVAAGIAVVVGAGSVLLGLRVLPLHEPVALLREVPTQDQTGTSSLLGARMVGTLPEMERLGVRAALRRPVALLASALLLGGMAVVAASMSFFSDGLISTLDEFLSGEKWDYSVVFLEPVTLDRLAAIQTMVGAQEVEPFRTGPIDVRHGDLIRSQQVTGTVPRSRLQPGAGLIAGRYPEPGHGTPQELAINLRLAQSLGVGAGDAVELSVGSKTAPGIIVGVVNNYAVNQVFSLAKDLDPLMGSSGDEESAWSGAFLTGDPGVGRRLADVSGVMLVVPHEKAVRYAAMANSLLTWFLRAYGWLAAGVAIVLGIVLVHLSAIERAPTWALLSSLGYAPTAVLRTALAEWSVVLVSALCIVVPGTMLSLRVFQERIHKISIWVDTSIDWPALAFWSVAAAGALVLFVTIETLRFLRRDPGSVLREATGGE